MTSPGLSAIKVPVLPHAQGVFHRGFCVVGMSEQHRSLADGNIRRGLRAVLSSPRINVLEKRFMGVENILIGKPFDPGKLVKRQIEFRQKRSVFNKL